VISEAQVREALHNVMEMCPYERNRAAEEYQGTYREAKYAEAKAKEYGFTDVHIERFPLGTKQWAGEMAELWVTEPGTPQLVTSFRDVTATLATGSHSADVTADLVYVGRGDSADDYKDKDVKGKIVLCSGPVGAAHNLAVRQFGAEGVVSFFNGTGKPIDRPDQIGWSGIGGGPGAAAAATGASAPKTTFGFILSLRMGLDLLSRVEKHQHVKVHALVKATEYDTPMQVAYTRTALVESNGHGPIRMTLDTGVRGICSRELNFRNLSNEPSLTGANGILELKFHRAIPPVFEELIERFSLIAQPISKYRIAIGSLYAMEVASV